MPKESIKTSPPTKYQVSGREYASLVYPSLSEVAINLSHHTLSEEYPWYFFSYASRLFKSQSFLNITFNIARMTTKELGEKMKISHSDLKSRLIFLRSHIPSHHFNYLPQQILKPVKIQAGYQYNPAEIRLITLDALINGNRTLQFKKFAKTAWPILDREIDEIFEMPTVEEFSRKINVGSSTIGRTLSSLYGQEWKSRCITAIKQSRRVTDLPLDVRIDTINYLLEHSKISQQGKEILEISLNELISSFELRNIREDIFIYKLPGQGIIYQSPIKEVPLKKNSELLDLTDKSIIDIFSNFKLLINTLGFDDKQVTTAFKLIRRRLNSAGIRVTVGQLAELLGISYDQVMTLFQKINKEDNN